MSYTVAKCPTDRIALTNRVAVNTNAFASAKHISFSTSRGGPYYLTLEHTDQLVIQPITVTCMLTLWQPDGVVGFSGAQRKWAALALKEPLESIAPFNITDSQLIG